MHKWTAEAIGQPEVKFEGEGKGDNKEILAGIKEFLVKSGLEGKCSEGETFKVKLLDIDSVVDAWRMTSKPPRGKLGKEMVARLMSTKETKEAKVAPIKAKK